jgi:GNAT superfamily N-acetyltransferase
LEPFLIARGYRHKTPTFLMVADAAAVAIASDGAAFLAAPNSDFVRLTLEGSHCAADGEERLSILARIERPKAYVGVHEGGEIVACGASVAIGDWASVYVMRTAATQRRKGHGRRVLAGIAGWAQRQGATRLYLQVDETNAAARALYCSTGFRDGYRYLHYVGPDTQE